MIYARIVGFLADKMRLIVQTYQKKTYQIVEIGEIVGLSGNFGKREEYPPLRVIGCGVR